MIRPESDTMKLFKVPIIVPVKLGQTKPVIESKARTTFQNTP